MFVTCWIFWVIQNNWSKNKSHQFCMQTREISQNWARKIYSVFWTSLISSFFNSVVFSLVILSHGIFLLSSLIWWWCLENYKVFQYNTTKTAIEVSFQSENNLLGRRDQKIKLWNVPWTEGKAECPNGFCEKVFFIFEKSPIRRASPSFSNDDKRRCNKYVDTIRHAIDKTLLFK